MTNAYGNCGTRPLALTPWLEQTLQRSIVFIMGALALAACRDAPIPELTVNDFLGPEPGKTYVYEGEEELRVEVVGIDRLSPTRIRVRETATLHLVDGNETSSTTSYDVSAVDGQLIQENSRGRDILLKEPISDSAGPWNVSFEVGGQKPGERRPFPATCRVMSVGESVVMGAKVQTVSVECVSESEALSVVEGQQATDQRIVVTRQFAKAIGLVSEHVALRIDSESIGMTSRVLERIVDAGLTKQPGSEGARP